MEEGSLSQRLMQEFGRLPGIGPKSAERITQFVLQSDKTRVEQLARLLMAVKEQIRPCRQCFNLTEQELCAICSDPGRDQSIICVVEQPKDLLQIEKTKAFRGTYHVLAGRIAPLEGMTPDRLTIDQLVDRVRKQKIREVIMATNPTLEGDGTSLYLINVLADFPVKVTRLARGISTGTSLEFANKDMLAEAINGRQNMSNE